MHFGDILSTVLSTATLQLVVAVAICLISTISTHDVASATMVGHKRYFQVSRKSRGL